MENSTSKLMNRNFFLLWQGQLVSQIGTSVFNIAMVFWIKQATGSATLMGTIAMVSALPGVILGPIGGTFADRHSRRTIIIFCDIVNGLFILSFAGLMLLCPEGLEIILIWLFIVSALCGVAGSFFRPAISSSIQNIPLIYVMCGLLTGLIVIIMSLSKEFRIFLAYDEEIIVDN